MRVMAREAGPLRDSSPRLGLAAALGWTLAASAAHAQSVDALYEISLAGLPIGTATLSANLNPDAYRLEIRAKLTGLAGLLTGGKGAGIATGSAASGKVVPATYALSSSGGSGAVLVRMALTQGSVAAVEITPPLEPKADRVPLLDEHKKGIVDPVSALLIPQPARGGPTDAAACERVLPVFDGAGRFDITLSPVGTRNVSVAGYSGPVAICSARYTPIAGHRAGRKSTQFMAENRDIETWLAPIDGTRFLMPYRIQVRTMIGMATIEAVRFMVGGKGASETPRTTPTTKTAN